MVIEAGFSEQTAAAVCVIEVIALPFHSSLVQNVLLLQTWASAMFLWLYFFLAAVFALYQICLKPWLNFRSSHKSNFPFSLVSSVVGIISFNYFLREGKYV
jgi:hypothetical protein